MSDQSPRRSSMRLVVLLGLLAIMLGALAYDYKIARPKVDQAMATVTKLNQEINASADAVAMTNLDIQEALNKKPSRTFAEGQYEVEQYSWISGVLFRSHNYYAVYRKAEGELRFQTHFPNELPADFGSTGPVEVPDPVAVEDLPGGPTGVTVGGGPKRKPKPPGGTGEGEPTEASKPETAEPAPPGGESTAKPAAEEKPAASPEGEKPAAEKPAEKAAEKPAEKAAEKPAEKAAEKPAEKAAEKPAEKAAEKPAEKAAEKPAEKAAEKPAEKAAEKPAEKAAE